MKNASANGFALAVSGVDLRWPGDQFGQTGNLSLSQSYFWAFKAFILNIYSYFGQIMAQARRTLMIYYRNVRPVWISSIHIPAACQSFAEKSISFIKNA